MLLPSYLHYCIFVCFNDVLCYVYGMYAAVFDIRQRHIFTEVDNKDNLI